MKNNSLKILLFVSATLLLSLFCFIFIFTYQKINSDNQETQQDAINLQKEISKRDNTASLNQYLQKIASERILLEKHFIKSSDVVPFLNTIEKLAQDAGISSEINSVNAKIDNVELVVDLKAIGKFEEIYKFLTLLENSPYELEFATIDMHKINLSKDSRWEAIFKIQLLSFIP